MVEEDEIRLLVVDDEAEFAFDLIDKLDRVTSPRFKIEHVDRLFKTFRRLEKPHIDLVLLDLFLPESKGLRTLHKVRGRFPDVTIIAVTNLDDIETGIQAVRDGAQDYMVKGDLEVSALVRAIRHALERHRVEKALRVSEAKHRQMVSKLQTANAELETFTYSVSHDLRAPLRAITGFAAILHRKHASRLPPDGLKYVENIVAAGERMGWLIDDLLAYSRLDRGELGISAIPLLQLFEGIRDGQAARLTKQEVTVHLPDDLPVIHGNKVLLSQIFSNLIANGINYHRDDVPPIVEVRHHTDRDGMIVIEVADNGIGIPLESQEKIFQMFERLHTQDEYAGTGIGLAIVKKAIELLGGSVAIESTVGVGTTFIVTLPTHAREAVTWRT